MQKIHHFFALYLLPSFSNNLLGTYLSKKVGYKPVIFYMEVITIYPYILPLVFPCYIAFRHKLHKAHTHPEGNAFPPSEYRLRSRLHNVHP